jgi:hypothetical protein
MVGGSLTGSYDDKKWGNKIWSAGLYPKAGYFITSRIACGIALTAVYTNVKQTRPDGLPTTTLKTYLEGIGFFGRYYHTWEKNALIGELSYSFDRNRDVYETFDWNNPYEINRIKYNGQNNTYAAGIGYARFLTEKTGLEFMAHYRYRYDHAVSGHNNFAPESFSNGITLGVGLQIYI